MVQGKLLARAVVRCPTALYMYIYIQRESSLYIYSVYYIRTLDTCMCGCPLSDYYTPALLYIHICSLECVDTRSPRCTCLHTHHRGYPTRCPREWKPQCQPPRRAHAPHDKPELHERRAATHTQSRLFNLPYLEIKTRASEIATNPRKERKEPKKPYIPFPGA